MRGVGAPTFRRAGTTEVYVPPGRSGGSQQAEAGPSAQEGGSSGSQEAEAGTVECVVLPPGAQDDDSRPERHGHADFIDWNRWVRITEDQRLLRWGWMEALELTRDTLTEHIFSNWNNPEKIPKWLGNKALMEAVEEARRCLDQHKRLRGLKPHEKLPAGDEESAFSRRAEWLTTDWIPFIREWRDYLDKSIVEVIDKEVVRAPTRVVPPEKYDPEVFLQAARRTRQRHARLLSGEEWYAEAGDESASSSTGGGSREAESTGTYTGGDTSGGSRKAEATGSRKSPSQAKPGKKKKMKLRWVPVLRPVSEEVAAEEIDAPEIEHGAQVRWGGNVQAPTTEA